MMLFYQAFVFATWLISSISATNGGQSIRQWQIEDDNKPSSVRYEPNWYVICFLIKLSYFELSMQALRHNLEFGSKSR